MATTKKVKEPKRKAILWFVREDLWTEFRLQLMRNRMNVTKGLEEAITEWLRTEGIR